MRLHAGMLACTAAALMLAAACGGRNTIASRSAAAYDEAKSKGIPIQAGEHGGHAAPGAAAEGGSEPSSMAGMDHSAMPGMDPAKMPGMQHEKTAAGMQNMAGMDHSSMPGMDPAKMPGMRHDKTAAGMQNMAGMDHSAMPGMDHATMSGMQHDKTAAGMQNMAGMDHSAMPGMEHGAGSAQAVVIQPPTTNDAIARTAPAATLRGDVFDAPAPASVDDAAKTSGGATPQKPPARSALDCGNFSCRFPWRMNEPLSSASQTRQLKLPHSKAEQS